MEESGAPKVPRRRNARRPPCRVLAFATATAGIRRWPSRHARPRSQAHSSIAAAFMNSARTRCGQVWTLSSPGPIAFLIETSIRLPV